MKSFIKAISFAALAGGAQQAMAMPMDFDFSGNFTHENDVVLLDFSIESDRTVTLFSSSWDDGGLDPILSIWDGNGNFVASQDDAGSAGTLLSNGVGYDFGVWDVMLGLSLSAGDYIAAISMYNNFSIGSTLSEGFLHDGDQFFSSVFGCSNGVFCDFNGDNTSAHWDFHILNADIAAAHVPEPGTIAIVGLGLAGLGFQARRMRQSNQDV